ncbi:MAG: putative glucosamine--fructose-6-phosphate aminotransferase [Pseudomonadota bacterium]|jgi:glucosamine--fructose-6-phosphate aminotransferase (isomerizing)
MCGIVAAVSKINIIDALINGLQRLEYRGYDSCGIAVINNNELLRLRTTNRINDLTEQAQTYTSTIGIAHTRWATHGKPTTDNAHPHFSSNRIALVHNGIIENFEPLRNELIAKGYTFVSQTDTEVMAHLIDSYYEETKDLLASVTRATKELKGAYAVAVFTKDNPSSIIGARLGSPLVLGLGKDENFLVSDIMAIADRANQAMYLEDGDIVNISQNSYTIFDKNGHNVERNVKDVKALNQDVDLGPYAHYMQKEIFEQPTAIADTLSCIDTQNMFTPNVFGEKAQDVFSKIDSILILACGTSYYSGCTAKYWLESVAGIPTNVEIASEYRYRDSVSNPKQLIIVVSQSGETADTLAALRHAKDLGHAHTLSICNVSTSGMVQETELSFLTKAGREIGVASTKAFTTQLVAFYILANTLAKLRGKTVDNTAIQKLQHLPLAVQAVLALEPAIIGWSEVFARKENALFLGRGMYYPIALEGALKLKEITYIHAEAYPAGELKHGPLALVTEEMPVVTVAPNDALLEKLKSNIQEVQARGGEMYVFADANSHIESSQGMHVITLPENLGLLSPIVHVVALQLLSYHTAIARGTDVDKPRNLAKSVTVE